MVVVKHDWIAEGYTLKSDIGGHSTEFSQVANSVSRCVREAYPINGVPPGIALELENLSAECAALETRLESFIGMVSTNLSTRKEHERND